MVHLAVQTGLPVVPFVVHGAHRGWQKSTLALRSVAVHVEVLPAIDTSHWSAENTDEAVEEMHALFRRHLRPDQQPAD